MQHPHSLPYLHSHPSSLTNILDPQKTVARLQRATKPLRFQGSLNGWKNSASTRLPLASGARLHHAGLSTLGTIL
jgi:hypothetical protein